MNLIPILFLAVSVVQPADLQEGEFVRSVTAHTGPDGAELVMEVCRHHPGGRVSCETRLYRDNGGDVTVVFGDVQ